MLDFRKYVVAQFAQLWQWSVISTRNLADWVSIEAQVCSPLTIDLVPLDATKILESYNVPYALPLITCMGHKL